MRRLVRLTEKPPARVPVRCRFATALLAILLACSCGKTDVSGSVAATFGSAAANGNGASHPPASSSATTSRGVGALPSAVEPKHGGLTETQLADLFHLSEGSEFVPLCALKLRATELEITLAQYFQKYNLIPDPQNARSNPFGLPIGLTVSAAPTRMVGFNCAACHVGRIQAGATAYTVVGAPSGFNIRQFYDDLIPWLSDKVLDTKDHTRLRKIAWCMVLGSHGDVKGATSKPDAELDAVQSELRSPLDSDANGDANLYAHLEAADASPSDANKRTQAEEATASASSRFQALSKTKRQSVLRKLSQKCKDLVALLPVRLKSLDIVSAVGKMRTTKPGPGRVDAFMTALNIMTKAEANVPMTSPVAFPALWGLSELHWFHWDDNTNATFQRNVGQAIGTGALFAMAGKRVTATSLKIKNIEMLEGIVKAIQPPRSPFPVESQALFKKGEGLFEQKCGVCHDAPSDGKPQKDHPQAALLASLGTDSMRLANFEQNVKGERAIELLSHLLAAVEKHEKPEKPDENPRWETNGRYGFRKLQGVWATAPYLHNDSVPTLADLLTKPSERPNTFVIDRSHYDTERVGFKTLPHTTNDSFEFNTAEAGNGNQGHDYGTDLQADDKRALLAYLLQL